MTNKGQIRDITASRNQPHSGRFDEFVLDKTIFSNVFDKDIKRVYKYKKAERLAKAVHLVAPAFRHSPTFHDRLSTLSISIVDAALMPPHESKETLAHDLLSLSSILAIARTAGMLSPMNAELIAKEAQLLLEEVAGYEEPRLALPDSSTLAELSREASARDSGERRVLASRIEPAAGPNRKGHSKGHVKDTQPDEKRVSRREAVLSVLQAKGASYIKDLSTVIRDVSEKTIQRELQALVEEGVVARTGERRWTQYSLASA